jgi:hypothetical protein
LRGEEKGLKKDACCGKWAKPLKWEFGPLDGSENKRAIFGDIA